MLPDLEATHRVGGLGGTVEIGNAAHSAGETRDASAL